MRGKPGCLGMVLIAAWAVSCGRDVRAQGPAPAPPDSLPAALEDRAGRTAPGDDGQTSLTPAPQPLPGSADMGLPVGGMDAGVPEALPINLATALTLAGVQQNIFTGPNFRKGRQTFFVAGGPSASITLTDAVFAPLAARRVVAARRADLQAARNDTLYNVAQAYFNLQEARGRLLGTGATVERAERLVTFAVGLAPSLIPPLEVNRAKTELQTLRQAQQVALRDWRIASSQLAEILLLDPETLMTPIEPPFLQLTFVAAEQSAAELMPIALRNRPEIASRRELVVVAEQLLRQEKNRPLLPTIFVPSPATSTGLLAAGNDSAGPNGTLLSNGSRFDIEVAAVWQLQNAGIGNVGRIRQRRAERDVAAIEATRILYRVRSEVAQAVARLQTARVRVVETEEEVRQAIESADKNFIGLRQTARPAGELLRLVVRPQEVVQAIVALNAAYSEYSAAVNEYNLAQFEVYRALGQPAQWVTCPRPATAPAPPAQPAPEPASPAPVPAPLPLGSSLSSRPYRR